MLDEPSLGLSPKLTKEIFEIVVRINRERGTTILVPDVHAFPGHIACDADSRSELVVPLRRDGRIFGVLDLDSPTPHRVTAEDQAGMERLMAVLLAAGES